jgi:hypothetical protein
MTTILTAAAAAYLLLTPAPCTDALTCAIEHVESRGNTWAVSSVGARGLRQVMPSVTRWPRWLLHVPMIGRAEGDRVLGRWMARCGRKRGARSQLRCALRAYACGNRALRDPRACGRYADAVMAARGGE